MPYRLTPTLLYLALKENLDRNAKATLEWVERAIREDPSPDHPARLALEDGSILDTSAEEHDKPNPKILRVVYRIVSDDEVELEVVLDEPNL